MQAETSMRRQLRLAVLVTTVGTLSLILGVTGCSTGGGGGGTQPAAGVSLADLQGEWQYIRTLPDQSHTGDCITITGARVTAFVESCDREDLLFSAEDITTNGSMAELRFSITVRGTGDGEAVVLDITTTLSPSGAFFVGPEQIVPRGGESEPENQVGLRRPPS
jgi:hypothetical protein